jgi:hypothetical protein
MMRHYDVGRCFDGYEVIDVRTGRPASAPKDSYAKAMGLARVLNTKENQRQGLDVKFLPLDSEQAAESATRRTPGRRTVPSRRAAALPSNPLNPRFPQLPGTHALGLRSGLHVFLATARSSYPRSSRRADEARADTLLGGS